MHQYYIASNGVAKRLSERLTETGVKDKTALQWMETLLARYRKSRSTNPSQSQSELSEELLKWLHEQPGAKINPLFNMPGIFKRYFIINR